VLANVASHRRRSQLAMATPGTLAGRFGLDVGQAGRLIQSQEQKHLEETKKGRISRWHVLRW
jgi:hypothetical protein